MQDFTSLGIELLKYGYRSFSTHQLYCPQHGLLRLNIEVYAERWPCPICGAERECGFLAHGYTRQALPSFNIIVAPARWNWIAESDYLEKPSRERAAHHMRDSQQKRAKAELRKFAAEETRQDSITAAAAD